MSGHTPGPWYVGSQSDLLFIITQPPRPSTDDPSGIQDVEVVAQIEWYDKGHVVELANANLIAAAPDLLAALEAWLAWLGDDTHTSNMPVHQSITAIAKTKGTTS